MTGKKITPAEAKTLVTASLALKEAVEGIGGTMNHGTWRNERNVRLKDAPEWVNFYLALAPFKED